MLFTVMKELLLLSTYAVLLSILLATQFSNPIASSLSTEAQSGHHQLSQILALSLDPAP